MKILKKTKGLLYAEDFYIKIFNNKLYISNFTSLGEINSEKIIIRYKEGYLIIKGENITLSKLQSKEVLLKGKFNIIEFR